MQAELKPVKLVGRLLLTFVETSLLKKKLYKSQPLVTIQSQY